MVRKGLTKGSYPSRPEGGERANHSADCGKTAAGRGLCGRAHRHECAWSLACWKISEDARRNEPEAWGDHGGLGATVRALAVLGDDRKPSRGAGTQG